MNQKKKQINEQGCNRYAFLNIANPKIYIYTTWFKISYVPSNNLQITPFLKLYMRVQFLKNSSKLLGKTSQLPQSQMNCLNDIEAASTIII